MQETSIETPIKNTSETTLKETPTHTFPVYDESTMSDFAREMKLTQNGLAVYKSSLRSFYKWLKENEIVNPNRENLLEYKEYLIEKYKQSTVQMHLTAMRKYFEYLSLREMYEDIAYRVTGIPLDKKPVTVLTEKEIERIRKTSFSDPSDLKELRDALIFSFITNEGIRVSEMHRLNVGDVQQINRVPVIIVQKDQENSSAKELSYPSILLLRDYLQELSFYYEDSLEELLHAPLLVNVSTNTGGHFERRLSERYISIVLDNALKKSGYVDPRYTPDVLRRTIVRNMMNAGADVTDIKRFMRYKDIRSRYFLKE